MANHKRGKPKNQRSGCLMCKPHKMNGAKGSFKEKASVKRKLQEDEEYDDAECVCHKNGSNENSED